VAAGRADALRNPCGGASCALAGNEKTPAKTTPIAAVRIRIIPPTIDLLPPQRLRLPRQGQLRPSKSYACARKER
jgi:hypothetical protein